MKKIESFRLKFCRNVATPNGNLHGWVIQQKVWYGWSDVNGTLYGSVKNAQKALEEIRSDLASIGAPTVQVN